MRYFLLMMWTLTLPGQDVPGIDSREIVIINTGDYIPYQMTNVAAGPAVGNILNAHYFPGINFYKAGRYKEAEAEFTYTIIRPHYMEANPRLAEFMSNSHYLRGMIYAYHATGVGRYSLAKADFEAALKWNPLNHVVYLELSSLYATLGFTVPAEQVLRHLLDLKPEDAIARDAQRKLDALTPNAQ